MHKVVLKSEAWKRNKKRHVIWLWYDPVASFNGALQSFDDASKVPPRYVRTRDDGSKCDATEKDCYNVAADFSVNAITTPYWWDAPIVPPSSTNRSTIVAAAWSNRRGKHGGSSPTINVRLAVSEVLKNSSQHAVFMDTSVTNLRGWNHARVVEVFSLSQFCVVPYGDSPSRRSLSTCIVAGCIPVICSDNYVAPYQQFDWTKFSIHIPEATCADGVSRLISGTWNVNLPTLQRKLSDIQKYFVMPADGTNSETVIDGIMGSLWIRGQTVRK